jgi:hypothetical protein
MSSNIASLLSNIASFFTSATFISGVVGLLIWIGYALGALVALGLLAAAAGWVHDKLHNANAPVRIAIIILVINP